jgi:signal transduction histidine kinase
MNDTQVKTEEREIDPPVRVLLVEDNPGDARLAEEYLKYGGSSFRGEVTRAACLAEALKILSGGAEFDVILLDLWLPDSNGIETFEQMRSHAGRTAIIVLSGQENEDLAREIVKRGGQDCLAKDMLTGALMRRAVLHAIERKAIHEELRAMQMQLIQAEKMESVGRLAAGVAHEVKNPLAMILMGIDYLTGGISPDDPNVPKVLEQMADAVHRADLIVRGLLDFSSNRKVGLKPSDINALIRKALILLEAEFSKRDIFLRYELSEDLPPALLDPSRMQQVLVNVIFNALQSVEEARDNDRRDGAGRGEYGVIVRTTSMILADLPRDEGARSAERLRNGDAVVMIEILDTGIGIPEENAGRLFDPFFTSKPTGTGTGLGLTVVKKIIDLHQGLITLGNRSDARGAVATIVLRASKPENASPS